MAVAPTTLVFADAGVLIAAARSISEEGLRAAQELFAPGREFAASIFVRLEVEPKARYHRRATELAFYRTYFTAVRHWVLPTAKLCAEAHVLAERYGLAALDALHVTAAMSASADLLLTTERPDKPMFRVPDIAIRSVRPI